MDAEFGGLCGNGKEDSDDAGGFEQGDRMGLIRFGSRVDVYMPRDACPNVKVGDRAVGGITVLAQLTGQQENPA